MLSTAKAVGKPKRKKEGGSDGIKIKEAIFHLFSESQYHISSHRKNVHALLNLQRTWCHISSHRKNVHALLNLQRTWCRVDSEAAAVAKGFATVEEAQAHQEEDFFLAFMAALSVVLGAKRMDESVGRLMRFVVGFIVFSAERTGADDADVVSEASSTMTSRFIENLMLCALEGVDARERLVRARLCQVLVACVNAVDELSDSVWQAFRAKMTERLFDKEAAVRVQAVHAMARLQALPLAEDEAGSGGLEILDVFMDLLQHDPAAEVRKTVLGQIDVTPRSLGVILARRRDVDPKIRRFFYATKLGEIDIHNLTIEQRDQVLRSGLTDRDEGVKKACIEMIFSNWIHSTNSNLIEFLACLDVMANREMAESALECFFGMHAGLFESFNAQYLENLTVETAFVLRVFCQHTLKSSPEGKEAIQEMLPELTQMATYIHRAYESLLRCPLEDWEEGSEPGLVRAEVEFVLGELLLTCRHLDFADEVGRRLLEDVLLELLTNLGVGDANYTEALALLRLQSPTPAHFYGLASGLVADFKDVYAPASETGGLADGPEGLLGRSLESLRIASTEKGEPNAKSESNELPEDVLIMANLRALEAVREAFTLAPAMDADDSLMALLVEAVIPAINSGFEAVQALGLLCLALACSLSRDLAVEYAELFMDFISLAGTAESSEVALRTVFDLVLLYGTGAFPGNILDALTLTLCDDRQGIQSVATEGFSKLLLHGILPADQASTLQILQGLLQLYYHPSTEGECRLRQCLAYFFPAFALSKAANQRAIAKVAVPFLVAWLKSGAVGIAPSSIAAQLAHLTDASSLVEGAECDSGACGSPHDTVLLDACWAVLDDPECLAKPLLCVLLPKLSLAAGLSPLTVKKAIMLLGQAARLSAVAKEKAVSTAANKLLTGLLALDDVEAALPAEEMEAFKERLKAVLGTAAGPLPAAQARASTAKPAAKKTVMSESAAISNPLDDLDDILED